MIFLHTKREESFRTQPQTQYCHNTFPSSIAARPIDEELLQLWAACHGADPSRRFIYNFQIVEYAAHYVMDEDIRRRIRKLIASPHAHTAMDEVVEDLFDATLSAKWHDTEKFYHLLGKAVDPAVVWKEVHRNIDVFQKPMTFEGGFEVKAITKKDWQSADFAVQWPRFVGAELRNIRNGLSHAKEMKSERSIPPTATNLHRLQHWATIMSTVASEVMLFRNLA